MRLNRSRFRILANAMSIGLSALALTSVMPATAAASGTGEPIGIVAIRFLSNGTVPIDSPLTFKVGDKEYEANRTGNPRMPDTWLLEATIALRRSDIEPLVPVTSCIKATKVSGPERYLLEDSRWSWLFVFRGEQACWSLLVESEPVGYPFQIRLPDGERPPRKMDPMNAYWFIERDLPRDHAASVAVYNLEQVAQQNPPLVLIPNVTYKRLERKPWTLGPEELEKYIVSGENLPSLTNTDLQHAVGSHRMRTEGKLKSLLSLGLTAEGVGAQ